MRVCNYIRATLISRDEGEMDCIQVNKSQDSLSPKHLRSQVWCTPVTPAFEKWGIRASTGKTKQSKRDP